jgi:exopolyphosphatase / guanosine-5'-triphosphate,3'-diphosphate pyrophosphatase
MRIAVLDLGTNTFNLLIVDILPNGRTNKIFNEKLAPKIGLGGINDHIIIPDAFERGIHSLAIQKQIIETYKPDKVFIFGTSALRNAKNGNIFVQTVKDELDLDIHIISGEREAELIYHGNKLAFDWGTNIGLILDIGGGSNEFILANNEQLFWKQSFEIGVSRLLQLFKPNNPFEDIDILNIEEYVESKLQPLFEAFKVYPANVLIGSSGAFDTFRDMIVAEKQLAKSQETSFEIQYSDFEPLKNKIINLSQQELVKVQGMDPMRVDMIGIAAVFVDFIMRKLSLHTIIQSNYSLKEGVVDSLIRNDL